MKDIDVELLFKKLVILKEDKADSPEVEAEDQNAVELPAAAEAPKQTTAEPTGPAKIAQAEPEIQIPTKCLLYPLSIKAELFEGDSNLSKISKALGLTAIYDSAICLEDVADTNQLNNCSHIWLVGFEDQSQFDFLNPEIKMLFSANVERLKSKEEKLKMYEPLKAFAAELVS